MPVPEKQRNLEQQFRSETGGDLADLDNLKISEVVGETVGENFSDGSKSKSTQKREEKTFDIKSLITTSRAQKIILPTIDRQRAKVRHALEHKQRKLIRRARKIQNSSRFSAAALEEVYLDIRRIQSLLDELLRAAGKRIVELYRQYVIGSH